MAPPRNVTLFESERFVRQHGKRIASSPETATLDEIAELALVAIRLRDAHDAERNALVLSTDHGMRAW